MFGNGFNGSILLPPNYSTASHHGYPSALTGPARRVLFKIDDHVAAATGAAMMLFPLWHTLLFSCHPLLKLLLENIQWQRAVVQHGIMKAAQVKRFAQRNL